MSIDLKAGNAWEIIERTTNPQEITQNEALFALSNGHIGIRGGLEEGIFAPDYLDNDATYMNGLYETEPIVYGEWAYGYAKNHQTICPLPNMKNIRFSINGEWYALHEGRTTDHQRVLDLQKGTLTRSYIWENKQKDTVKVRTERFVPFDEPELIAMRMEIISLTDGLELSLETTIDTLEWLNERNGEHDNDPRVAKYKRRPYDVEVVRGDSPTVLRLETKNSKQRVMVGVKSDVAGKLLKKVESGITEKWKGVLSKGQSVILTRYAAYHLMDNGNLETEEEIIQNLNKFDYEKLKNQHLKTMSSFWEDCDIQIEGDDELQKGLRFNLFHLNQAAGRDGKTNMAAKGLTGPGYEGHYFWDTEMYMLPFFIYTQPKVAKQLLLYRHAILSNAEKRAREMGIPEGVLFPWRTINGEEASAYYPAGTAQFHINADIAHAVYTYIKVTEDEEFASKEGLEILIQTARFWLSFGHYDGEWNGEFVINGVTGPDEYTAIVNNNFYTNLMAKHNLIYAKEIVEFAIQNDTAASGKIMKQLSFDMQELAEWEKAANAMRLPYDFDKQLTLQDDYALHRKKWDFENTPKENYPLLLHYHPLEIYRHQVNKQADTILAEFIFTHEFSLEQMRRDYDYYESITTHDSSLSRSIFGIMASRVGYDERAYRYFMDTALMDLVDLQGNIRDGVHVANMGGSWLSMVHGFAGMRLYGGKLHFSPRLPTQWQQIAFKINYQSSKIKVVITQTDSQFYLVEGKPFEVFRDGKTMEIQVGD